MVRWFSILPTQTIVVFSAFGRAVGASSACFGSRSVPVVCAWSLDMRRESDRRQWEVTELKCLFGKHNHFKGKQWMLLVLKEKHVVLISTVYSFVSERPPGLWVWEVRTVFSSRGGTGIKNRPTGNSRFLEWCECFVMSKKGRFTKRIINKIYHRENQNRADREIFSYTSENIKRTLLKKADKAWSNSHGKATRIIPNIQRIALT